jgi:uncharacterized protein
MIAVDTNLLVYAHRKELPQHTGAFEALRTLAEGQVRWGIPVGCVHEFIAIVTNVRLFSPPSSLAQAFDQLGAWLASPVAEVLHTGERHIEILTDIAARAKVSGGQIHDARIAATCVEHGVSLLWTADRDFGRFKSLKTLNPLV